MESHAWTVRARRRSGRKPSRLAQFAVIAELVVLVAGFALVAGWRGANGGPGGPPAGTPGAPGQTAPATHQPTSWPSPSPTLRPTPPPSAAPTPRPTPEPTPAPTPQGPPACAYRDVLTEHREYHDWPATLLDTIYRLPSEYDPSDLEVTSAAGLAVGYQVRAFVIPDLKAMAEAARAAGAPIQIASAYRSFSRQAATFEHWVNLVGAEQALRSSARAGHSEHQLGTTLDITSRGGLPPWEYRDWATTKAGAWMAANAWRYGFVMSYPKGAFAETCYQYEPWHYRFVGRELAKAIVDSGLTPREFLWRLQ